MTLRTRSVVLALAGLVGAAVVRAADSDAFAAVHDGVVTVYAIDDLTTVYHDYMPPTTPDPTPGELADRVGTLVRDVTGADHWTTAGGTDAAMRVTPALLTVKASPQIQEQVVALLGKLREGRQYVMHEEYRIVDSDAVRQYYADAKTEARMVYLDQKTIDAVAAEDRPVLATSEQTPPNGQNVLWLDGAGLDLPTLRATATAAFNKDMPKYATVFINASANATASGVVPAFTTWFTNVSGGTAAIRLDDGLTRWLLVKVTVRKRADPAAKS